MENEWYDVHYIDFGRKVIIDGRYNEQSIEIELTDNQKEKLYDFNEYQNREKKNFFRNLLSNEI